MTNRHEEVSRRISSKELRALSLSVRLQPNREVARGLLRGSQGAEIIFDQAFEKASAIAGVLGRIDGAIKASSGLDFNEAIFSGVQQDVLERMRQDPLYILTEEYFRQRHDADGTSELLPLVPNQPDFWPDRNVPIPKEREELDGRPYIKIDARLLRILLGTTKRCALTRQEIALLAAPLLYDKSVSLTQFENIINFHHKKNWELVVIPADYTNEEKLFLRRRASDGDQKDSEIKEREKPKVHILVEDDNNAILINGRRVRLSTGTGNLMRDGERYIQKNEDAIIILRFLQRNQGKMFSTKALIEHFRETFGLEDENNHHARVNIALELLNRKIKLGTESIVTVDKGIKLFEVGITHFDVSIEYQLTPTAPQDNGGNE